MCLSTCGRFKVKVGLSHRHRQPSLKLNPEMALQLPLPPRSVKFVQGMPQRKQQQSVKHANACQNGNCKWRLKLRAKAEHARGGSEGRNKTLHNFWGRTQSKRVSKFNLAKLYWHTNAHRHREAHTQGRTNTHAHLNVQHVCVCAIHELTICMLMKPERNYICHNCWLYDQCMTANQSNMH